MHKCLQISIFSILKALWYLDEYSLKSYFLDHFLIISDLIDTNPFEAGEVHARKFDTWKELRQEGMLSHILVIVEKLDSHIALIDIFDTL
jgi:hypothetical protein